MRGVERQRCERCKGDGREPGSQLDCIECGGWGTVKPNRYDKPGARQPGRYRKEARRRGDDA